MLTLYIEKSNHALLILLKQFQSWILHLNVVVPMAGIFMMLMLIKPGEDFLDVIAKVLSLTAILTINYYYYDT